MIRLVALEFFDLNVTGLHLGRSRSSGVKQDHAIAPADGLRQFRCELMHAHDFNLVRSKLPFQSFRRAPAKPVVATERIAIRDNENSTHDFDIDRFYVAPDALVRGGPQRNEEA